MVWSRVFFKGGVVPHPVNKSQCKCAHVGSLKKHSVPKTEEVFWLISAKKSVTSDLSLMGLNFDAIGSSVCWWVRNKRRVQMNQKDKLHAIWVVHEVTKLHMQNIRKKEEKSPRWDPLCWATKIQEAILTHSTLTFYQSWNSYVPCPFLPPPPISCTNH